MWQRETIGKRKQSSIGNEDGESESERMRGINITRTGQEESGGDNLQIGFGRQSQHESGPLVMSDNNAGDVTAEDCQYCYNESCYFISGIRSPFICNRRTTESV